MTQSSIFPAYALSGVRPSRDLFAYADVRFNVSIWSAHTAIVLSTTRGLFHEIQRRTYLPAPKVCRCLFQKQHNTTRSQRRWLCCL